MTVTDVTVAAARASYEARADEAEGHHMPAWEGLSDLERDRLVHQEDQRWRTAFLFTAAKRETSLAIMKAITYLARDEAHAVAIWEEGFGLPDGPDPVALWATVTDHGARPSTDFYWGDAGRRWWDGCDGCGFLTDRRVEREGGWMLCQACDSAIEDGDGDGGGHRA